LLMAFLALVIVVDETPLPVKLPVAKAAAVSLFKGDLNGNGDLNGSFDLETGFRTPGRDDFPAELARRDFIMRFAMLVDIADCRGT